jgi:peptide-methionine (S)-S-oxide reductase
MTEKATFAAGCFWGVEEEFRRLDGVLDTAVGYEGGHTEKPSYKDVCTDSTGHAEVVQVEYDPAKVSYQRLVELFFATHDPTQVNRQGPDYGTQYRSAIFVHTPEQGKIASDMKTVLETTGKFQKPIATEIVPAQIFWRAEDYHQKYLAKRGTAHCHI